ncbi:MAG: Lysine-tRNA ligase [Microgenomates group bacterium GW2011_GWC1_38_12]|nr:MAG: Lysine-tRNA ligase [Microgenomates group bacterium GW2011_GWC1_38_12]
MAEKRLEEIRKVRLEKAKKLRELGINPYPSKVKGKPMPISEVRKSHSAKASRDDFVEVAGRIMGWREHGNVVFADLKDETGKIQLWFQKNSLGEQFKLLKYFDIGDFIYTKGKVTKTSAGELSVDVSDFQVLTKSIRPLPSTWHGLKDVEERYRKRYLDLILNESVKERFDIRGRVVSSIREFLDARGYKEVETPTLQPVYGGGFAKPFITHHNALDSDFYLRISDEMYLKRLIVGGFEKVYEITKVFRNEGVDYDHNPEFTMFEAMLVEAVKEYAGIDPLSWQSFEEAKESAKKLVVKEEKLKGLEHMHTIGEVAAFVFEELVEEKLIQPTFIYDYPIEVSPLAKKCDDERFTQRFEMFAAGTEFGNNYTELNDPVDLSKRFIEEKKREKAGFEEAHQTDYDYLTAIEYGFPPTCGVAIGIDRIVMLFTDAQSLKEVILFPTMRPEK